MTAAHRVRGSCGALSGWGRSSQSQDSPPPRVVRLSLPHPHRSDLPPSFRPHPLRSRPLPLSSVLSQGCRILRPWPSTPGSAETIFGFCICFVDLFSLFCFRFSNWAAVEASGRRKDAHWECGWLPKVMGGLSGVDLSTATPCLRRTAGCRLQQSSLCPEDHFSAPTRASSCAAVPSHLPDGPSSVSLPGAAYLRLHNVDASNKIPHSRLPPRHSNSPRPLLERQGHTVSENIALARNSNSE